VGGIGDELLLLDVFLAEPLEQPVERKDKRKDFPGMRASADWFKRNPAPGGEKSRHIAQRSQTTSYPDPNKSSQR